MSSAVEMPQLSFAQVRSRYREKGSFFTIGSDRQEAHESAVGMLQQAAASLNSTNFKHANCSRSFAGNFGEQEVGKLARALAARGVFGIHILKQSTINGDLKRGLKMLNKKKLSELCLEGHRLRTIPGRPLKTLLSIG